MSSVVGDPLCRVSVALQLDSSEFVGEGDRRDPQKSHRSGLSVWIIDGGQTVYRELATQLIIPGSSRIPGEVSKSKVWSPAPHQLSSGAIKWAAADPKVLRYVCDLAYVLHSAAVSDMVEGRRGKMSRTPSWGCARGDERRSRDFPTVAFPVEPCKCRAASVDQHYHHPRQLQHPQ